MFFALNMKKDELLKMITKTGGALCLDSSLEKLDKEQGTNEIHVYESPELIEKLKKEPRGDLIVNFYSTNIPEPNLDKKSGSTSTIQTIIDLRSRGLSNTTEKIAMKKWNTMQ